MIIKTNKDLDKFLEKFNYESVEYLAYDTETTSLNPRTGKIIGFGVSDSEQGFYFCHLEYDTETGELVEHLSKQDCVAILNILKTKKLYTWNGSFDVRFTKHYFGVDLVSNIYSDGMLAKHTVDEQRPFGLKEVAKKLYGDDAAEEQKLMKASIKANGGSVNEYFKADLELMGKYAIQDCILTYRINEYYLDLIQKQNLSKFYFKDEIMPFYREVCIPMEYHGVPVDTDALFKASLSIREDIEKLEAEIQSDIKPLLDKFEEWYLWSKFPPRRTGPFAQQVAKYFELDLPKTATGAVSLNKKALEACEQNAGSTFLKGGAYLEDDVVRHIQLTLFDLSDDCNMFNLSSKAHLKKLFFEKLEETPLSKTDKGNPQCNDDFLDVMADKYEWAAKLRVYNKLKKLEGSYIDKYLQDSEDGVFYPRWMMHRTVSGRLGSDIQQLPRPFESAEGVDPRLYKYHNMVRKFFIAGEGYKFIDSDYESLEPHIFSHVSGDEGLKNIFRLGHDFYSTIAIQTEGLHDLSADKKAKNYLGKLNKPLRQKAKAYALGVPYSMGDYALSKTLDISQKEAARLIDQYLNGFPELKKWIEKTDEQVLDKGYVASQAGRVRHFPSVPKIWYAHSKYILDPLKLWDKYHSSPKKYESMQYLRKQVKNAIGNGRNFQIQSLAASIVNRAAVAINRELKRLNIDGYVCANIHDQLVVRVPERHAERCRKIVQFIMENNYKISIPLKAPAEVAEDFYEGH